jgi:hypothetical protein
MNMSLFASGVIYMSKLRDLAAVWGRVLAIGDASGEGPGIMKFQNVTTLTEKGEAWTRCQWYEMFQAVVLAEWGRRMKEKVEGKDAERSLHRNL